MELIESIKKFLGRKEEESEIPVEKIVQNFDSEMHVTGAFFDDKYTSVFNMRDKQTLLDKQRGKIKLYRGLSKTEEVADGIDEIINEIIYSENETVLKVQLNEENEKIADVIQESFKKVLKTINTDNMYNIVRQSYIDGKGVFYIEYNANPEDGLKNILMLDPINFYYDSKKQVYKYHYTDKNNGLLQGTDIRLDKEFEKEDVIVMDFGLVEQGINLGYLEYAIKSANQLKTLEDLLIPMRFSRSISRRVFNVDTGELSNTKSEEVMKEMQKNFKYKKFYNTETGEITNQQHITSMVEDYWFANRSGGKGTTVDTLDETGNLGEINDILYFQKKLYKAMKIPTNRIINNPDADNIFDFDSTSVSREDMKFFLFISRLKKVYTNVFKELLKRELIITNVMSLEQYDEYKDKINIIFSSDNIFIEKLKLANFNNKLDIYSTVQEYNGKLFPVEKILKDVFKFTDEEINANFEQIAKEKKDSRYEVFYKEDDY